MPSRLVSDVTDQGVHLPADLIDLPGDVQRLPGDRYRVRSKPRCVHLPCVRRADSSRGSFCPYLRTHEIYPPRDKYMPVRGQPPHDHHEQAETDDYGAYTCAHEEQRGFGHYLSPDSGPGRLPWLPLLDKRPPLLM